MADGPFPEHYEPIESPIVNPLHPQQTNNPVVKKYSTPTWTNTASPKDFNVICTTYRLTEHYHYWTKNNPMNVQLVPEPFVEIPSGTGGRNGIAGWRQTEDLQRPQSRISPKPWSPAHQGDEDRRQRRILPDWHSYPLGLSRN